MSLGDDFKTRMDKQQKSEAKYKADKRKAKREDYRDYDAYPSHPTNRLKHD